MEERESGEGTRKKKKLTSRSHALERLLEMCCSNSFNIKKAVLVITNIILLEMSYW
jgi:hypothetical protein